MERAYKEVVVQFRCTSEGRDRLVALAEAAGQTLSDYLRAVLFNTVPVNENRRDENGGREGAGRGGVSVRRSSGKVDSDAEREAVATGNPVSRIPHHERCSCDSCKVKRSK